MRTSDLGVSVFSHTHTHRKREGVHQSHDPGGPVCYTSSSLTPLQLLSVLWTEHGSLNKLLPPYWDTQKPRKSPHNSVVKLYEALKGKPNRCSGELLRHCPDRSLLPLVYISVNGLTVKLWITNSLGFLKLSRCNWHPLNKSREDSGSASWSGSCVRSKSLNDLLSALVITSWPWEKGEWRRGGRSESNIAVYTIRVIHLGYVCMLLWVCVWSVNICFLPALHVNTV